MKLRHGMMAVTGFAASALVLAACSGNSGSGSGSMPASAPNSGAQPAASSAANTVQEGNTSIGTVLTDNQGKTLYTFDMDTNGTPTCTGGCAALWPGEPGPVTAAPGVMLPGGMLGTVKRPDNGTSQATWQGKPVYTFAQDSAPGDVKGDGFEGTWHAVKLTAAAGGAAPAPAGAGAPPASSSSAGGVGGYSY